MFSSTYYTYRGLFQKATALSHIAINLLVLGKDDQAD